MALRATEKDESPQVRARRPRSSVAVTFDGARLRFRPQRDRSGARPRVRGRATRSLMVALRSDALSGSRDFRGSVSACLDGTRLLDTVRPDGLAVSGRSRLGRTGD